MEKTEDFILAEKIFDSIIEININPLRVLKVLQKIQNSIIEQVVDFLEPQEAKEINVSSIKE